MGLIFTAVFISSHFLELLTEYDSAHKKSSGGLQPVFARSTGHDFSVEEKMCLL